MALSVPRVKLIIMSCQVMDYLFVDMVPVLPDLLSLVDVKELLVALDSGQLAEEAEQLAHHCGGVPVVLRATAAVLAKGSSTKTLSHIPHKTKKYFAIIKIPYNIKQTRNGNKEKHQ